MDTTTRDLLFALATVLISVIGGLVANWRINGEIRKRMEQAQAEQQEALDAERKANQKSMREATDAFKTAFADERREREKLQAALDLLRERFQDQAQKFREQGLALEGCQFRIRTLEHDLSGRENELVEVRKTLGDLTARFTVVSGERDDALKMLDQRTGELTEARANLARVEGYLDEQTTKLTEIQAQLDDAQARLAKLEAKPEPVTLTLVAAPDHPPEELKESKP